MRDLFTLFSEFWSDLGCTLTYVASHARSGNGYTAGCLVVLIVIRTFVTASLCTEDAWAVRLHS